MKKIKLILLIIFLAMMAMPAALMAAAGPGASIYYVNINTGNDTNDGLSSTTAWKTLHYAGETLADTDNNIINVAAGVYSVANGEGASTLQFFMSNSSILGAPGGGTIIDAGGSAGDWQNAVYLYACNNVLFSDFEVRNASLDGIYVEFGTGVDITRCNVHDNFSYGVVLYECDGTTTVNRNRIYDNPDGIDVTTYGSIYPAAPQIVNNLIFGHQASIIGVVGLVTSTSMSRGIVVEAVGSTSVVSPTIFHNTIDRGMSYGIHLNNSDIGTMTPSIQFNIITNCGTGIYGYNMSGTLNPFLDYNDLFGNGADYSGVVSGANDLNQDPLYADPTSGANYRLTAASPCIDAAVTSEETVDLDGITRPQGKADDIGCYEYHVPVITTTPGIIVTPTRGLVTSETGASAVFTVALNTPPMAGVTIPLSSSDPGEGTVSPASLTFTANNWYMPQTVTVTGVDDSLNDGDIAYTITVGPAVSDAFDYNGLSGSGVSVVNMDNDGPGFVVNPTAGLKTSRAGGSATFTVALTCQPAAPVTVSLSSSDPGAGLVSPAALTFTPDNWDVPQTVTVTGQDNGPGGNAFYMVITAPAVSEDADYNGLDPADVSVTSVDNLPPGQPDYVYPQPLQMVPTGIPVTLRSSMFYDPEGDRHTQSYWLISRVDRNAFECADYPDSFEHLSSVDLTEYTIPADVLAPGMAYRWLVGYQDSGSGVFTWSDRNEQEKNVFIVGQVETVDMPPIPPGSRAADFRMMSFHHLVSGHAADVIGDDLVGGYDTRYYRIGAYDPGLSNGGYLPYPSFNITPGMAIWVLARNGLTVDVTGVPVTVTEDVDVPLKFNVDTNNGWNMVGPPNDRDYRWSDVEVVVYGQNSCQAVYGPTRLADLGDDNPYIDVRLWEWSGGAYVETSMMTSSSGYWVRAKQKGVSLRFPATSQVSLNHPEALLAAGMDKVRKVAGDLLSPIEAVAYDDNNSPPRPMDAIESDTKTGSSGGGFCFIDTLNF